MSMYKNGQKVLTTEEKNDVNAEADTAFTDYDPPTDTEMDGIIGAEYLNGNGVPEQDNIRAHIYKTGGRAGGVASKTITYDGSASYSAFTVTGLVEAYVVGYITTVLSNHADQTSVGTATSTSGLIAATAGSSMQTANAVWVDNSPSKFVSGPMSSTEAIIGDGEDISVVGTANLAAGVVTLYCFWTPISDSATVVAA